MKLYTEEQVKQIVEKSIETGLTADYLMLVNTPIELPSDEEIDDISYTNNPYPIQKQMHIDWSNGFERGAKWMRDKIQGGNK
jgi:hypothetical protein